MSNLFKGIGKAFAAVVKVVKKIAIPVLIIGAIVLTGGAAIGALSALGTILGSIGITGTMASIIGGAVSGIALGAATGAVSSLISGAPLLKSIEKSALIGGLTGGVAGGLGLVSANGALSDMGIGSRAAAQAGLAAQQGIPQAASAAGLDKIGSVLPPGTAPASISTLSPNVPSSLAASPLSPRMLDVANTVSGISNAAQPITGMGTQLASSAGQSAADTAASSVAPGITTPGSVSAVTGNVAVPGIPTTAPVVPGATVPGTTAAGGGFFNSPWMPMIAGQAIQGIGGALTSANAAKTAKAAQQRIFDSYNVDPSALFHLNGQVNSGLETPAQRYGYDTPYAGKIAYDPQTGRILAVGG